MKTLDLTGKVPELNKHLRLLMQPVRSMGVGVIDRGNLTILEQPGELAFARSERGAR